MDQFKDKPISFFTRIQHRKHLFYYIIGIIGILIFFELFFGFLNLNLFLSSNLNHKINENYSYDHYGDILHLNNLNEICFHEKDSIITYAYNSSIVDSTLVLQKEMDHSILIQLLSQCPDVDIYLPLGLRNHGYCEDGMAYVKFLKTRALPTWVFDIQLQHQGKSLTYFDLCPNTAILFMNHYWDKLHERPDFPPNKKIVLMPNVEMYELEAKHYQGADYVLAKTYDGYQRITAWYAREGNPRGTKVFYTQHVSSDPTQLARHSNIHIKPRDFKNLNFFHANGHSTEKSTGMLLECWAQRPDFPLLDVYSMDDLSRKKYEELFHGKTPPDNVRYHWGEDIDAIEFGKIMAEASVILCPSSMEGFGHYINQARAAGALVATTDAPPMNELIDHSSGILIDNDMWLETPKQLMGKGYKMFRGGFFRESMEYLAHPHHICAAVDYILGLTPEERKIKAKNGQERYLLQFQYFRSQMNLFRKQLLYDIHGEY